mmetsp:Transcript_144269/g.462070  ORF Transcript_144269/g.462070 Transcript_144269/m.462070 type:complete len:587 (-) Transcript_144269:125-1885(-)
MEARERSRSPRRGDGIDAGTLDRAVASAVAGLQAYQPQQYAPPVGELGGPVPATSAPFALATGGADSGQAMSTEYQLQSNKLGQLLGFRGMTIQRIKDIAGVQRLHILDKDKAKHQPMVNIQITGLPASVAHASRMLDGLQVGDQTELGHMTSYLSVDPQMIGKLLGHKGQTVKEMTEHTGCYIEIQQRPEQGVLDGQPRVFFAGPPEKVEAAVSLAERFIEAPGSRLDSVLPGGGTPTATYSPYGSPQPQLSGQHLPPLQAPQRMAASDPAATGSLGAIAQALMNAVGGGGGGSRGSWQAQSPPPMRAPPPPPAQQGYMPAATSSFSSAGDAWGGLAGLGGDQSGPLEERYVELPARFKGHLLGLKGATIETIRQVSGVVKCHMVEKGSVDRNGSISIQIVGTAQCVEQCHQLINNLQLGDHSGIGHSTTYVMIDSSVIGKIMGAKGQTVREMTDRTGCYIEIQQYPEQGVFDGQPKLFIAGPPENVESAVSLVERFIAAPGSRLDTVLDPGDLHSASASSTWGSPPMSVGIPPPPPPRQHGGGGFGGGGGCSFGGGVFGGGAHHWAWPDLSVGDIDLDEGEGGG